MMFDFNDIRGSTKDEQLRAWALEQAIEFTRDAVEADLIDTASVIEEYVKNGKAV